MKSNKQRNYRRNINLIYIYSALTAGLFLIPVWITFQQEFLSFSQMAFFNAAFYILIFLFELPTGALADMIGRKYSLTLGSIANVIAFFLIGMFPSLFVMWFFIICNALGASLISGAKQSLLYDTMNELGDTSAFPKVSARETLYFQIVGSLTAAAGGYVFTIQAGLPYILRGVFFLFSIIPAILMIEPHIDSEKFTLSSYVTQTKMGVKEAFKSSYVIKLSLIYILVSGIAMSNQRFFSQPYMLENGLDDIERSWIAFGIKMFIAFLTVFLASRKKLFGSRYFLFLLPSVMIISLLLAPILSWPLMIVVLVGVALPSGSKPTFLGYPVQQQLDSKYRATALSALNMFVSLAYAINNLVGGFLSERYSISWYYFGVGIFVLVVIIPLVISIVRKPILDHNQA